RCSADRPGRGSCLARQPASDTGLGLPGRSARPYGSTGLPLVRTTPRNGAPPCPPPSTDLEPDHAVARLVSSQPVDEQPVADGDQEQADGGDGTGADATDQAAGRDGPDHEGQSRGQEEQASLQSAEAAKVLQILRTEEQPRDEHAGGDEHQECAGRDRTTC